MTGPKPGEGPREYGQITGPVDPRYARRGVFIKSFPLDQFGEMLAYAGSVKLAMTRHGVYGELVFTLIVGAPGRFQRTRSHRLMDTWQVYLMTEGGS